MTDIDKFGRETNVEVLACPKCGAQIKGSGSCGYCNQLLLVTREYGVLQFSDADVGRMEIKPPSKVKQKEKDPDWEFKEDGVSFVYPHSKLKILGKGSARVGARMLGVYYHDHPERLLPGLPTPGWREVEDYAISKVLSAGQTNEFD